MQRWPCARSTAIAAVTLIVACAAPRQVTADDREAASQLAERLDSLRTAHGIPGLAIAILRDTTVVLMRGIGLADVESGREVDPHTPFNIASVAKPISAVLALQLVERGVLDLDRPMRSYPDFPEFCADVRAFGGIFYDDFACVDSTLTLRHVLSMRVNGTPGGRFFYNPPSYSWASRPIAEVSARVFSDLVVDEVFRPAGMTESARTNRDRPLPAALAERLATPYHHDSTGALVVSPPPPPQGDGAAGGVISTVADLARFDIALTQGRLLSPASREAMWTPAHSPAGDALPYGLGWFVARVNGERLVWHTGLWEGAYSALYLKLPDRQLTLILLANSDALQWAQRLDEAAIERSPFARAFVEAFASR